MSVSDVVHPCQIERKVEELALVEPDHDPSSSTIPSHGLPLPSNTVRDPSSGTRVHKSKQDQIRWTCKLPSHSYCFTNAEGAHTPLSSEDIELWTNALYNGEATLLAPPKSVTISQPPECRSDDASITSVASRYQRPFRWQSKPSLTDLRSMRVKLKTPSIASSSELSSSTASSGIPGIGYYSGKTIKWIGIQILDVFEAIEIRRRRSLIPRLVKEIADVPPDQRTAWLAQKRSKVNRAIEDTLELSSESYKLSHRLEAIDLGTKIRGLIVASDTASPNHADAFWAVNAMRVKTFPLYVSISMRRTTLCLLSEEDADTQYFADTLRETLLQDPDETDEEGLLAAEVAAQLCHELAYGRSSAWRHDAYKTLYALYYTPIGLQCLHNLAGNEHLMEDMTKRLSDSEHHNAAEHARAIDFFAMVAHDIPHLRKILLDPTGVPLLVKNIRDFQPGEANRLSMFDLCASIAGTSRFAWCSPVLTPSTLCPALIKLLIYNERDKTPENPVQKSWTSELILFCLSNLVLGFHGQKDINSCMTEELRAILPMIEENVKRGRGEGGARRAREFMNIIWAMKTQ